MGSLCRSAMPPARQARKRRLSSAPSGPSSLRIAAAFGSAAGSLLVGDGGVFFFLKNRFAVVLLSVKQILATHISHRSRQAGQRETRSKPWLYSRKASMLPNVLAGKRDKAPPVARHGSEVRLTRLAIFDWRRGVIRWRFDSRSAHHGDLRLWFAGRACPGASGASHRAFFRAFGRPGAASRAVQFSDV